MSESLPNGSGGSMTVVREERISEASTHNRKSLRCVKNWHLKRGACLGGQKPCFSTRKGVHSREALALFLEPAALIPL